MPVPRLLRTPSRVALEVGRLAVDALPRPGRLPRSTADLDAATLSRVLGREVERVSVLDGTSGTTDRSRLAVEGRDLPGSVFVKMAATDAGTRLFGGLARLGAVEIGFYRDLRPGLSIEAPRGPRHLLRPCDRSLRDRPGGPDRARCRLRRHDDPAHPRPVGGGPEHSGRPARQHRGRATEPVVARHQLGRRAAAPGHRGRSAGSEGGWSTGTRAWPPGTASGSSAPTAGGPRLLDEGPQCVLHGDPHPGNLYLVEDRVGFLDWQAVRRGNGLRDATYNLVLGLTVDERRAHERDLLDHYRGELAAHGGPELDPDAVWETYRRMAAYAYVATVFTSGLGGLQGEAIADAGLRRAIAAVDDLETAAVL